MTTAHALAKTVCAYNPAADGEKIIEAVEFAKVKHAGQVRSSGEPYYTHPLEVAGILADMRMDPATILTAILHDTLEDTDTTPDELEKKFGKDVLMLVNGVSKLNKIEGQTVEGKQAENFRKLVLAMSEDIRVLLVKLADRLHNMRTLHHIAKPDKRRRIARETLEIYAPLAERIGMHQFKEELEDLAFGHLNTEARESITNRLSFLRQEGTDMVNAIINEVQKMLKDAGIPAQVTGREKTRYSIWRKMQRKNISFEQFSDIMAFRVVVENLDQCYHVLGLVHSHYPTVPGRFKDFISTPKPNGYRSIHTTVIGPFNQRIEIQIRTRQMHEEADLGVAAHWAYKQGNIGETLKEARKYRWLRELVDILEQEQRAEDFMENTKLELFQDKVYCFTPKGDLIELPSGATPIDFAYAIHSGVGDKCVGAKVNGRIAPLNTRVQNGDQIDIITSKTQTPSPTWERFVITGKARAHIRRYIRQQQRDEYMDLGRSILQKMFKQEGYEYTDKAVQSVMQDIRGDNVKIESIEDVFVGVGSGNLTAKEVFKIIFPGHKGNDTVAEVTVESIAQSRKPVKSTPMAIRGLIPGMAVHYARCCHPIPGDKIVGIVTTGKGVTVHTIDCETLEQFADTPERWLDVSWGDDMASESHIGRLNICITNQNGALAALSTVISKSSGNISNLKITNRSTDFWEMIVDVAVSSTDHLTNIIAALRATPQVVSVDRSKSR
ncbi:MAG: bifunctional (p)ppGpp synthetase/guanosine-3',5'-bis(diphosphate) 3'-pyrophosphohydrolase [Pseudomonadota bacterium]